MQWAVLIEHDPADPENYGAVVPLLGAATGGHSYDHVLEMARDVITITLEDVGAGWQQKDLRTYLPTLAVIEVDVPTPEDVVRQVQAEAVAAGTEMALTLREAAARCGSTVFVLRRAIRAERLTSRRIGHLRLVYPTQVEHWLTSGGRTSTGGGR